jgi:hypothetical protein
MKDLKQQTQWFIEPVRANMAYKKLKLSNHAPPQIRKFIASVEDLSFSDVPIWPGLADVGPDTEFVGNPVTIRDDGWAKLQRARGHPARRPRSAVD